MSGCTSTVTSPAPTISVSLSSTDTRTAEIYTLSLHDALPISRGEDADALLGHRAAVRRAVGGGAAEQRRVVGVVPRRARVVPVVEDRVRGLEAGLGDVIGALA